LAVRYPEGARHDLGLEEAIWALGTSLLFLLLSRRQRPLGLYVSLLSLGYAPVRFALDYLRVTDLPGSDPRYFGLTPAQYGTFFVLAAGLACLRWTLIHRNEQS
jgi:phosphatidylglycerol:prolipoprotein diacylglycerol transferase